MSRVQPSERTWNGACCVDHEMSSVEPVLAHDALNHAVLNRVFGVGVRPTTSAVQATEVLVVPENKQSVCVKEKCTHNRQVSPSITCFLS